MTNRKREAIRFPFLFDEHFGQRQIQGVIRLTLALLALLHLPAHASDFGGLISHLVMIFGLAPLALMNLIPLVFGRGSLARGFLLLFDVAWILVFVLGFIDGRATGDYEYQNYVLMGVAAVMSVVNAYAYFNSKRKT